MDNFEITVKVTKERAELALSNNLPDGVEMNPKFVSAFLDSLKDDIKKIVENILEEQLDDFAWQFFFLLKYYKKI